MTAEGEEVRLTGTGAQAAMVLGAMLPGLDNLATRALEYPPARSEVFMKTKIVQLCTAARECP